MSERTERFWPIDEGDDPAPPPDRRLVRRNRLVFHLANATSAASIVALVAMANVVLDARAEEARPAVVASPPVAETTVAASADADADADADAELVTFEPVLIARRERARPRKHRVASSAAVARTRPSEPPVRALVEVLPAVRPAPPPPAPRRYGHFH